MKRLDEANVILKLYKCTFAAEDIEWVGYKLLQQGVTPINSKKQRISGRVKPTNLKQSRSFLGAVNQFNKFIPNLAQLCFPFPNLLKKDNEWNWSEQQQKAFKQVNEEIKKANVEPFQTRVSLENYWRCKQIWIGSVTTTRRK